MPAVINTNVASLNAQRNLNSSQSALQTSLQRLSSGLRINSAKDDAAGMAITERMTSQIRGLNQASRNANDGVSLAQTAEGGLSEVGNNLQRIRELAIQSANSTNSASDRTSLNAEVTQLLAEIQRVATTSQFNGQNILDGTFTAAQFQVGANANQTITASTGNSQTSALGSYQVASNSISAVSGTALTAGQLTLNGIDVGSSTSGSAEAISAAINGVTNQTGVSSSASTVVTSSVSNPLLRNQSLQSGDLVINGVSIGAVAGSSNVATQGSNVAAAINAVSTQTGVTAAANGGTGALTLTSNTGKTIDITTNAATTADGATRVENATGLELASVAKTFGNSVITVAAGARQVVTHTSTATSTAADTLTVAGVTFTYSAGANSATNIQISGVANTQGANVRAALALNSTVTDAFTITGATTDAILTAKSNVKSTAYSDGLASAAATANAGAWAQGTAGGGVAIGDTLKVGGLTYEFTRHNATAVATAGNIQVKLGTGGTASTDDDILTATNLAAAVSAQQAAGNGTVGFTSRTAGAVTVTNTLYGTAGVVAAPTEPVTLGTAGAVASVDTAGVSGVYASSSTKGTLTLNSANTFSIGGTSPAAAGLSGANVGLTAINTVDISTLAGANNAISLIDGALSQVSTIRGSMGALQNRFSSVVSSLSASSENLSSARSRILDADFAAETAQLTRNQILQQAGTAMLAQANQLPNNVLSLLR
ncbi:flagellin N-terminal helical domain-containing protein [Candidatus Nitrotoga sp. 1052]|uniref:flagellin N-terminal helical domain-containing protein n=1 Tax=Candidatus Nitrotoga sp. 1052 TaxID=2886964 RepID=UPI001F9288AF|nr:flagellin [Candidatus Nitrotoga sp. 1052]CAH1073796.1 Flagellin protein FlaB [Candidatus Nitrotoga sp. 1052]